MRLRRFLCLVLLFAVIFCGVFSVSAYAAVVEQYTYNGVVLPNIEDIDDISNYKYRNLYYNDAQNVYYLYLTTVIPYKCPDEDFLRISGVKAVYKTSGDLWEFVRVDPYDVSANTQNVCSIPFWSNVDIYVEDSTDLVIAGTDPVLEFITVPDPPIFLPAVGQIFTSAISWVGDVGSTILQQPLLLAFCALPLCGIGIGIFKRLKTAS